MFTQTVALLAAAAGIASALPTATNPDLASRTVTLTGVTHSVVAGRGGALVFDPDNVVAEVGDIVEWHYLPKNHSIAQSSFGEPCNPLYDGTGFFSGFQAVASGQGPNVFQIVIEDAKPIWYYCAQTTGNHCQNGMAGAINQDFSSATNTLAAYKSAAAGTGVSVVPPVVQGGSLIPNPNPNSGF